ncbi:hypothetical protein OSTOST_23679 [Ostertagia ostertagi]
MRSNQALNIDQDKKVDVHKEGGTQTDPTTSSNRTVEEKRTTELFRRFPARNEMELTPPTPAAKPTTPSRVDKPPLSIREFGVSLTPKKGYCDIETTFDSAGPSSKSVSSSNHIKYSELEKGPDVRRPIPPTPIKYVSVERSSVERLRELAGRPSTSIDERVPLHTQCDDRPRTSSSNDSFDVLRLAKAGIAINTFGDRSKQRFVLISITNLTFLPQSKTGASEVFERPDSMTLETSSVVSPIPRKPAQSLQQMVHRKLLNVMPDEVDRSVGSSTMIENETMPDGTDSYVRDAEIRLNLFMNDTVKDETTV